MENTETLRLDLGQDATRQNIRTQLFGLLGEEDLARICEAVAPLATTGGHCHDLPEVLAEIDVLDIPAEAKDDARAVYRILNAAEAQVHGCAPDQTHFHEVGNHEAIANVVEVCMAVRALSPVRIEATPVQAGKGKVQCAHGLLDIPAPATAAIIARGIPVAEDKREGEWCTPTSAALILHLVDAFVR